MKKVLSIITVLTLLACSLIPAAAFADEAEYVYGTAQLTWEQFWSNEPITYSSNYDFAAVNEVTDTEGMTDLGGFDAVSRATSKHGIYRGAAHYAYELNAADENGNTVTIELTDIADIASLEDGYGAGKNFYAVTDGDSTVYTLAQPAEGEYVTYTITDFKVTGYKAWPVRVPAGEAEAAAAAVGFTPDESVTESTGRIKTVSVDADGNVSVSAMAAANGADVNYTGSWSLSYNDKYGDYLFIEMKDCEKDWGMNLVAVTYAFYGETNPAEAADAAPIAVYGTKYGADTWWKSNGSTLHLGINTSYRHGGDGQTAGAEQNGWWGITVMSAGYQDYTFYVQSKPAYAGEITAALAEDNATVTVSGIADADWANTTIAIDGIQVTGFEAGVKTLDSALSIGAHEVTVTIGDCRDNTATIVAMSSLTAADITLENNTLTVANGELGTYIVNIDGIAVNGETISGKDLGSIVFNEDGSINFDAVISGKRGDTIVFPEGSAGSYELMITSTGYQPVILTTTAAE